MKIVLNCCFFMTAILALTGQEVNPTPAAERSTAEHRKKSFEASLFAHVKSENIGPTIFNGRVADLDVNPADPAEFFVAYASGGLWYTRNNGTTFVPLFQNESVITIGDIAVDWPSKTIYLGSGEQNSSRSSYAGNGIYKSTDLGKTWTHLGLEETHHISRVVIHPGDPHKVWVAALGHLYSTNAVRGVFMSSDGGRSWTKTLYVNDDTGASDLLIHPSNPSVMYAATWQRTRRAWNFTESGPGSGIYRSVDGGKSWDLVSVLSSGFVTGEGCGRIGLDMTTADGKDYLYAIVDNNNRRPKDTVKKTPRGLNREKLLSMTLDEFLKTDKNDLEDYLSDENFPEKYNADLVRSMIRDGKLTPKDVATYNDNANTALFDTPVTGAEVYLTTDDGKSWNRTHRTYLDDVYFTYGYYFGQIRVAPGNPSRLYIFGVPILTSDDGGDTWSNIDAENVHGDHHALWVNPSKPGHIILGNDGGVNISYDNGANWIKCSQPEVAQFYYINTDNAEPYNVYGGTQDNGVWMGPHTFVNNKAWQSTGDYPYKMILGGDGMQVQIDSRDNTTVYAGFQFGNYYRINTRTRERAFITPKHDLGQKPYRWNWQTPILLSPYNQDILYMASNKLLRSMNKGKDFVEISGDLTLGGREGDVPFGTISAIDESRLRFGLIYAGTDDGMLHVTKDGGYTWTRINDGLPQGLWVSRVQASAFDEGTVYVTLNGYRSDHFKAYVYGSRDYGRTWRDLSSTLAGEPVNVIKEDPSDPYILYVGTDHGVYVSLDRGESFQPFSSSLPSVPVHDLVIQPKARHLLVGTHGRSIYKADVTHLPAMKKRMSADNLIVFGSPAIRHNPAWGRIRNVFSKPIEATFGFDAYSSGSGEAKIEIRTPEGNLVASEKVVLLKGLATYSYDARVRKQQENEFLKWSRTTEWVKSKGEPIRANDGSYYLIPGKYKLKLVRGSAESETELTIK